MLCFCLTYTSIIYRTTSLFKPIPNTKQRMNIIPPVTILLFCEWASVATGIPPRRFLFRQHGHGDTRTHDLSLRSRRPSNRLIKSRCSDTLPAAGLPSQRAPWQPRKSVKKRKRCLPWLITVYTHTGEIQRSLIIDDHITVYHGKDTSSDVLKQDNGCGNNSDKGEICHCYLIQGFLYLR